MQTNIKSFVAGSVTTLTIVALATTALAATGTVNFSTVNIKVGDEQVASVGDTYTLDNGAEAPYSISYLDENGGATTYIPIREFSALVGVVVLWDSSTESVIVGGETSLEQKTHISDFIDNSADDTDSDTTASTSDYSDWTADEEAAYQEFKDDILLY